MTGEVMPNEQTGYVLFMDVVGYSRRSMEHQAQIISDLVKMVNTNLKEYGLSKDNSDPAYLPTGDGMALVFLSNPEAPILASAVISNALKVHNTNMSVKFEIRMGIHCASTRALDVGISGPFMNYAGPALNLAQRVMDCGHKEHVLASDTYYQQVGVNRQELSDLFHDIGEYKVKGGTLKIHNIYGTVSIVEKQMSFGKSEAPERKIFVNKSSLHDHFGSKTRFASFMYEFFIKGLGAIEKMELTNYSAAWTSVRRLLNKHKRSKNLEICLTSLVAPNDWKNGDWGDYQGILATLSMPRQNAGYKRDVKRIHVISNEDASKTQTTKKLAALVLAESICNIKARIMVVAPAEILESEGVFYSNKHAFFLLDFGTYSSDMIRDVILSDIRPYFCNHDNEQWTIATFQEGGHNQEMYQSLSGNFYSGWDSAGRGQCSIRTLMNSCDETPLISESIKIAKKWGVERTREDVKENLRLLKKQSESSYC